MTAVEEYLQMRGVEFEVIPHERTLSTVEEARALGVAVDEALKTLVMDTSAGHVLVVIPGSRRVDLHKVRDALGDHHARLASEEELGADFVGYELGAMPPLGSLVGARTFVDPEVLTHETVVFAAGSQTRSLKARTADLFRDEQITVAPVASHPGEETAPDPLVDRFT